MMLENRKKRVQAEILNAEAIINWMGNDEIVVIELGLLKKSICEKIVDIVLNIR